MGASERGGLSRGLAQADPGPGVLGPEPCLGRLRAVGVFDDSSYGLRVDFEFADGWLVRWLVGSTGFEFLTGSFNATRSVSLSAE